VPLAVIIRSNEFEDFRCHKSVKVSDSVTLCNIYIILQLAYLHFFCFFVNFLLLWCHIVTSCHECHNCDMCHTCLKYHCHVSLIIQCVIGGLLGTDFNKVWAGWVCGREWVKSGFKAFGVVVS
jgi:hypothetical protein